MHRILVQLPQADNTWFIAAIGALGAILGALAGGRATYIIEKLKIKNIDAQRRQQIYSQLNGRKRTYLQCYASYIMNFIALEKTFALMDFSLRIPERITINGIEYLTNSLVFDPQLPKELKATCDELTLRLAQSRQEVWEAIGLIKILFTNTEDMITDIENFDKKFETLESEIKSDSERGLIEFQYEQLPHSKLNVTTSWPESKETKLREEYINIFDRKFENLLDHLKSEINREQENATEIEWWQFWRRD